MFILFDKFFDHDGNISVYDKDGNIFIVPLDLRLGECFDKKKSRLLVAMHVNQFLKMVNFIDKNKKYVKNRQEFFMKAARALVFLSNKFSDENDCITIYTVVEEKVIIV